MTGVPMSQSLRLLTYNIRKGKGASGRDATLPGIAAELAGHELDLLLCQEVFHPHEDDEAGQSAQLARAVGLDPHYLPNCHRRAGHHGNATLTHLPVDRFENHDVSTNPLERRGVLYARLVIGRRPLHVFNTHLGLSQRQRRAQLRRVAELMAERCGPRDPVVLAGDFNDWNGHIDALVTGELGMTNVFGDAAVAAPTWHSRVPVFNLDRVYVKHLEARSFARLAGAPWNVLSDHLPLAVEIDL
jgi:endonuclease/exonuclease/phosphatase family metal-dependent hydrolase